MAIRLSEAQIKALKARKLVPWRPQYCRVVHIRLPERRYEGPETFCDQLFSEQSSREPFQWTDPFCAECVKAALK